MPSQQANPHNRRIRELVAEWKAAKADSKTVRCTWPNCPCDGFTVPQLCAPKKAVSGVAVNPGASGEGRNSKQENNRG
jgi:hypothetical protein